MLSFKWKPVMERDHLGNMCVGRTLIIVKIMVKWILMNLTRDGFYCWAHVNT
jgi:hypothetical protein